MLKQGGTCLSGKVNFKIVLYNNVNFYLKPEIVFYMKLIILYVAGTKGGKLTCSADFYFKEYGLPYVYRFEPILHSQRFHLLEEAKRSKFIGMKNRDPT